jgi:hypothetical protein
MIKDIIIRIAAPGETELTDNNNHDSAEERNVVRILATSPGRIQERLQLVALEQRTFEINGPLRALPEGWDVLRVRLADEAALQPDEVATELANRILDACLNFP